MWTASACTEYEQASLVSCSGEHETDVSKGREGRQDQSHSSRRCDLIHFVFNKTFWARRDHCLFPSARSRFGLHFLMRLSTSLQQAHGHEQDMHNTRVSQLIVLVHILWDLTGCLLQLQPMYEQQSCCMSSPFFSPIRQHRALFRLSPCCCGSEGNFGVHHSTGPALVLSFPRGEILGRRVMCTAELAACVSWSIRTQVGSLRSSPTSRSLGPAVPQVASAHSGGASCNAVPMQCTTSTDDTGICRWVFQLLFLTTLQSFVLRKFLQPPWQHFHQGVGVLTQQLLASRRFLTPPHYFSSLSGRLHRFVTLSFLEGGTAHTGSVEWSRVTWTDSSLHPVGRSCAHPRCAGRPAVFSPTVAPLDMPTIASGDVRRLLGTSTRRYCHWGTQSRTPGRMVAPLLWRGTCCGRLLYDGRSSAC